MRLHTIFIAAAFTAAAAGSAFAAERTVVNHRADGTTVVKHVERHGDRDQRNVRIVRRETPRMHRVRVVRRVVWTDHHGNQHVRRIVSWRMVPTTTAEHVVVRHYG